MDTLGLWLGPLVAVVATAAVSKWLGWFQPKSKRRVAIRRIAERLASEDSAGYDFQYGRYLEHYLGGRDWREEADKMTVQDKDGNWCDLRGPAPKWWQH